MTERERIMDVLHALQACDGSADASLALHAQLPEKLSQCVRHYGVAAVMLAIEDNPNLVQVFGPMPAR